MRNSVAASKTRWAVAVFSLGGLASYDFMGAVVGAIVLAIMWSGTVGIRTTGSRFLVVAWLAAFAVRCLTAVIQSGYELILKRPEDPLLYESAGEKLAVLPTGKWLSGLHEYSASTRGIIVLHALVARFAPVFRLGIYVAMLSVACSMFSLLLMYQSFASQLGRRRFQVLAAALALSPPFVFWTSQNTKEGFVMLGIALFGRGVMDRTKWHWIGFGVAMCALFRPYVGVLLGLTTFVGLGLHSTMKRFSARGKGGCFLWPISLGAVFLLISSVIVVKGGAATGREAYVGSAVLAGGGSLDRGVGGLGPSSIVLSGVRAILTPPPWFKPRSMFDIISYTEGLGVAFLLIVAVTLTVRRKSQTSAAIPILALSLFSLCLIYGLGINIGTTLRIRTTFYPLIVFLLSVLSTKEYKPTEDEKSPFDQNQDGELWVRRPL